MPATRATTVQQRQEMACLSEQGQTRQAIAEQLGVSFWTVRKWARRAKRGGLAALVTTLGRPATGPMSEFQPLARYVPQFRTKLVGLDQLLVYNLHFGQTDGDT
jgi:transposase